MNPTRANAMVMHMMQILGSRFQLCSYDVNPQGWIFGVSEKARPGEFFDDVTERQLDGSIRKLRIRNHGGPTGRQMVVIEETSASIEEGGNRLIELIINKNDTTRLVPQSAVQGLSVEQVRELIAIAIADDRQKRAAQQEAVTKVVDRVVEQNEKLDKDVPAGLQHRQRPKRTEQEADKKERIQLWMDRAHLLGMKPPRLNAGGHIDKRWLRFAEPAWEDFKQRHPKQEAQKETVST